MPEVPLVAVDGGVTGVFGSVTVDFACGSAWGSGLIFGASTGCSTALGMTFFCTFVRFFERLRLRFLFRRFLRFLFDDLATHES